MITLADVSYGYRRTEPIITSLSHRFEAGTVTTVTGPSGQGKSTVLYLIGLMLKPWSGHVLWRGDDIAHLPDGERARFRASQIGFVFQDAALDPARTVLDNVTEGAIYAGVSRRPARRRAAELLADFGVELRADHRPGEVSGGQAQRVALCRALLNRPALILADEPTGNLDQTAAGIVLDALTDQAATGATVIVASHDPAVIRAGDHVMEL